MEPCNHTYTRPSGIVFRCDTEPHPHRPDAHYFVRDTSLETQRPASPMIHTPGERRR